MRTHPMVLYLANRDMPLRAKMDIIHTVSVLTHGHMRAKIGCGIYAFILWHLLRENKSVSIIYGLQADEEYYKNEPEAIPYKRVFDFIEPDTFHRMQPIFIYI